VISSTAGGIGPLDKNLALPLWVVASAQAAPPPATPFEKANDPFWDLPLEAVTGSGPTDPVSRGDVLPPGYTLSSTQIVTFTLGRTATSNVSPFVF
jgi:hypothetical protein